MAYLRLKARVGETVDLWVGDDPANGIRVTFLKTLGHSTVVFAVSGGGVSKVFGVGDVIPMRRFRVCGAKVVMWATRTSKRGELALKFEAPKKVRIVRRSRRQRPRKG